MVSWWEWNWREGRIWMTMTIDDDEDKELIRFIYLKEERGMKEERKNERKTISIVSFKICT